MFSSSRNTLRAGILLLILLFAGMGIVVFLGIRSRDPGTIKTILGILFVLILLTGYAMIRTLLKSADKRMKLIQEATDRLIKGDFRQRFEAGSDEEIRLIAENLNRLSDQLSGIRDSYEQKLIEKTKELKTVRETLGRIKSELENKMAERTADLETKVEELNRSQKALLYMVEDLNRTSQKLKDTQEELVRKERLAILGEFSGNISHELRNPLGVIDSSIYFLKMKLQDKDEKTQQHLERISNSVKTSTSIIENLLNLTRMNKPVLSRFDCKALITECLNSWTIPEGVEVIREFPDEVIPVMAESVQFQMVIHNLVKNAIAAMDEKGKLHVKIHQLKSELVQISVTDSGSGIDPANIEKVFQPLFSTKAKGIGLGLSITKMIIENHGGKIFVESTPGEGSTFIIQLPVMNEKKEVNNDLQDKSKA
jgi:signal transduction histidine kinase